MKKILLNLLLLFGFLRASFYCIAAETGSSPQSLREIVAQWHRFKSVLDNGVHRVDVPQQPQTAYQS